MKHEVTVTFDEATLAKFATYESYAKESDAKVRARIASDETQILFHVVNSLDEEIRKFVKTANDKAEKIVKEALSAKNAAKAEFFESFKIEFAIAQRDNDSVKIAELIAKMLTFD